MTLQLINVGLILSNFFFWTITKWNKIDTKIRNFLYSVSIIQFSIFSIFSSKKLDYNLIPSPLSNIHNSSGIKLLTRLRLGLSHLNEHKLTTILMIVLILFCTCSLEPESTLHLLFALSSL